MTEEERPYHHGHLPAALLAATAAAIGERGVAALSLREIARRAGVSHAAPAHHFGDKAGVLTALAAQGFALFTDALVAARDAAGADPRRRLSATGHAYVRFALAHPAHFEVMFQPDLHRPDDPALLRASAEAYAVLQQAVGAVSAVSAVSAVGPPPAGDAACSTDAEAAAIRAWALAHGLAQLCIAGPISTGDGGQWELQALLDAVLGPLS